MPPLNTVRVDHAHAVNKNVLDNEISNFAKLFQTVEVSP